MRDTLANIKNWTLQAHADNFIMPECYCATRDIFVARLSRLEAATTPLFTAVVAEVAHNSFDHNFANWKDIPGILYYHGVSEKTVIIADRGLGIRATLSPIKKDIKDDLSAVKTAITEVISGRAPERRGNGLKFVSNAVKNNWYLYLQSGNGAVEIKNAEIKFLTADSFVNGCFTMLKY